MKLLFLLAALFFFASAHGQTKPEPRLPEKPTKRESAGIKDANIKLDASTQFQYFIIKSEGNTYGYSIYADGDLYILQNTIPGVSGSKGFIDTTGAANTAKLVIKKIKQGEIPPAINFNDLKKIGVLK